MRSLVAYEMLMESIAAKSSELGMVCMPAISQIVETNASADFHRMGRVYYSDLRQTVEMADDKNGGPNYLKAWRLSKRMTLEELGAAVGTTASVIGYLESGERGLSAKWLRKLAPALDTSPGFLLDHPPEDINAEVYDMFLNSPKPVRQQIESVVRVMVQGSGTNG